MGWAYHLYDVISWDWDSTVIHKSFAIVDADTDDILFLCQLCQTNTHPLLHKIGVKREDLISRWGYVMKDGLTKRPFVKVKSCFEDYIDAYMKINRIKHFYLNFPPLAPAFEPGHCHRINPSIYLNFEPALRYTWMIDLSKDEGRMLADCEETTRQAVRKIEASGKYAVVEAVGTMKELEIYTALYEETHRRTGVAEEKFLSASYQKNIFLNLIPRGLCRVFFLKEVATGEYMASVAVLICKNSANYWWGSSKTDKEVGVNKYLLFKIIMLMREKFSLKGFFETGGAYVHYRNGKRKGLSDFKKSFGTFLYPIYGGTYMRK